MRTRKQAAATTRQRDGAPGVSQAGSLLAHPGRVLPVAGRRPADRLRLTLRVSTMNKPAILLRSSRVATDAALRFPGPVKVVIALAHTAAEAGLLAVRELQGVQDPHAETHPRKQAEIPTREAKEQALEAARRVRGDDRGV
jgi:hypothetical protein